LHVGLLAPGRACHDDDCAGGFCNGVLLITDCGVCQAFTPVGEACEIITLSSNGLSSATDPCEPASRCVDGTCVAQPQMGEPCVAGPDLPCLDGACLDGACAPRLAAGETCTDDFDCESTTCRNIGGGQLVCTIHDRFPDESCDAIHDCFPPLGQCIGGTCTAQIVVEEGDACDNTFPAVHVCDGAGLRCAAGTCTRLPQLGDDCVGAFDCDPTQATCVDGVCAPFRTAGQSCETNGNVDAGRCDRDAGLICLCPTDVSCDVGSCVGPAVCVNP
jgi:hypothetical protein